MIKFEAPAIHPLAMPTRLASGNAVWPSVDVLRLDQIHPRVSGNKWYKLKYNLELAQQLGFRRLLSCGGPHSNHLHALACAGSVFGFSTVAFIRGYAHLPLTQTLLECQEMGMELIFIDKKTYRNRYDLYWCQQQAAQYESYWIPEGGNNDLGRKGCAEIAGYCAGYDEVWMSIGSGCTFTGVAQALFAESMSATAAQYTDSTSIGCQSTYSNSVNLNGVMAIKGGEDLAAALTCDLGNRCTIDCDSHLGGFGKCPEALIKLINDYDACGLPLDPVYTAKLVWAFERAWQAGELDHKKRYLIIHSGGLQGRRGVSALSASAP